MRRITGSTSDLVFVHQTLPRPSIVPLPRIVIPRSFVNSIHHSSPTLQSLASVGAMIIPSSCNRANTIPQQGTHYNSWRVCVLPHNRSWLIPSVSMFESRDYLKHNVGLAVRSRERDRADKELVLCWNNDS